MKLSELFSQLSMGELSNLAMSNEGDGTIMDKWKGKLVVNINSALLAIYSRFELLSKDVLIELSGNRTLYPLEARFAEMNDDSAEIERFIKDGLHDKFTDDVIQITSVQDFTGYQFPINDVEHQYSLFTPQPHVLQVPRPKLGVALSVGYRARHPVIKWDITDNERENQEIILPFFFEDALHNYVAAKVFSSMTGQEHVAKSQELMSYYELNCVNIEDKDLASQTISTTNTVFHKRGFI
ncbi:putative tail fiber protein [Agrobacterium phage OLIVR2]|uniref:Putative tail fiber protein n=1 Tax=Agrobacterium phage OLIVR1 TaxID=2723769 RepID=A0A858MU65_9CAUD|nr:hypothetical protein [Xanthomonas campestris]YP_010107139.1 virion structural protein [Agrobacterium phage OLIVR1]QIW87407.1 putative tail fiber protein [Agrobacterium phage OLIVR2]QIW87514.1 putative tail fiber protein [Agrobacterium phage OLIVR3]MCF8861604.1 hypothetical protein [Xanthomonas campestris pv. campestris]QIW87300.1 putative tail fiber protein [Agrobacterium phage OLIVR1]